MRTKNREPLCALTQGVHVRVRSHGRRERESGNRIKAGGSQKCVTSKLQASECSAPGSRGRGPRRRRITFWFKLTVCQLKVKTSCVIYRSSSWKTVNAECRPSQQNFRPVSRILSVSCVYCKSSAFDFHSS